MFQGNTENITVFDFFGKLIDDLGTKGKAGNRVVYYNTRNVLGRFCKGNKNVMLSDINYNFLKKLETFLFGEGCSGGGDEFKTEDNKFVLPILSHNHKTPEQVKNRVKKCLKQFNKDLKEIAAILEIDATITSYVARHTFATTLKTKNDDIAKISEALGHADIGTTNAYLKRFEDTELDRLDELL